MPAVSQATNPPAPTAGALTVISQPSGATVYVNDAQVGRTPLTLASLVPAAYRIRVELDGYPAWSSSVRIEAGASEKLIAFIEKRDAYRELASSGKRSRVGGSRKTGDLENACRTHPTPRFFSALLTRVYSS